MKGQNRGQTTSAEGKDEGHRGQKTSPEGEKVYDLQWQLPSFPVLLQTMWYSQAVLPLACRVPQHEPSAENLASI